ncbi:MAG TPA: tetratricopeptide repeat protein [Pyrinomonadaceae bacterium]|nr:tetratricopeptide repeat protein [Pyrinomonadaceae bacterium]
MIVTEPPASRYETAEGGPSNEEHLLERISALENRLARLTERLDRGLDLLLRQAQNSYFDRALVKALVGLLTEDGIVKTERLEQLWNDRCQKDAEEQEESARREELRVKILATFHGPQRNDFENFINEGFLFIEDQQVARGIRSLERAAQMASGNATLAAFVGEHFFRAGKTKRARDYLEMAHESAPADIRVSLLLGLACADEGEIDRAKELLNRATRIGGSSFAAHYGLGRLFIAEENWQKALREFKRALATKPSPEAHYALGCLYYQLANDGLAARHLRKAINLDEDYTEAFYVLGLVYSRKGQETLATKAFAKARHGEFSRPRRPSARKRHTNSDATPFPSSRLDARGILTGGDRRLAEALRQDALAAFNAHDSEERQL